MNDSADDRRRTDELMEALRRWGAVFSEYSRHFSARSGLHPTDSRALMHIVNAEDEGTPLTHAELGQRVGLSSGATSSLLNRLEAAGHVRRFRDHTDRRVVTVRSTTAIHDEVQTFFAHVDIDLRAIIDPHPSELLDQVTALLEQLTAAAIRRLSPPD